MENLVHDADKTFTSLMTVNSPLPTGRHGKIYSNIYLPHDCELSFTHRTAWKNIFKSSIFTYKIAYIWGSMEKVKNEV